VEFESNLRLGHNSISKFGALKDILAKIITDIKSDEKLEFHGHDGYHWHNGTRS